MKVLLNSRKMRDIEDQNRDVVGNLAKREELLHQSNVCLDEKTRECASLNRQLEAALTDGRRASDQARDKLASKVRDSHHSLSVWSGCLLDTQTP